MIKIKEYKEDCVFCGRQANSKYNFETESHIINCENCGDYKINMEGTSSVQTIPVDQKHIIAGYLRELNELGLEAPLITSENIDIILSSSMIPKTVLEKLDKLLLYFERNTTYIYQWVSINYEHTAIAYAKSSEELKNMIEAIENNDYIFKCNEPRVRGFENEESNGEKEKYRLTLEGLSEINEIKDEQVIDTKQCFVAMWFGDQMMEVYNNHISKAIRDSGFEPLIISAKEHNNDICDEIIAEIRKSKFLVADLTGFRGGVYYEAGFAYGLGLPVIYTCKKGWFTGDVEVRAKRADTGKDVIIESPNNLHFDIEHFNFIIWEDEEDLYKRLKNRIEATIR